MSALAKNTSNKSSSKKSTSSKSTSKDNGASPKNAKGKTTVKAKAKFAGSLATAVKPTPPHQPTKPKQAPKPKKKDQGVPESPVMGQAAASPEGASAAATGPGATGAKQGAGKGAKSETSKAAKKVNTQKPSKIIKAYKGLGKNVTASVEHLTLAHRAGATPTAGRRNEDLGGRQRREQGLTRLDLGASLRVIVDQDQHFALSHELLLGEGQDRDQTQDDGREDENGGAEGHEVQDCLYS